MAGSSTANDIGKSYGTRGQNYFPVLASERLDIALCRASSQVERAAALHATSQGLGVGEHLVLKMLTAVGPCCQEELSNGLRIDRSVMVGCADRLEQAGFVNRERSAQDRRRYVITITRVGREALDRAESSIPGFLDETFGALTRDERDTLSELLGKLLAGLLPT